MSRGGRRPHSGRKLGGRNKPRLTLQERKDVASEVLDSVDQIAVWRRLVHHKQARISLMAMQYLTDRCHGKPIQQIQGSAINPLAISLQWNVQPPEWAVRNVTPIDPAGLLSQVLEPEPDSAGVPPPTTFPDE